MQLKREILEKSKKEVQYEREMVNSDFKQYKEISKIESETNYNLNKRVQSYNLERDDARRRLENQLVKTERGVSADAFVNEMNSKKEIQYDGVIHKNNQNVFQHMKGYTNFLSNEEGPSFAKRIDMQANNKLSKLDRPIASSLQHFNRLRSPLTEEKKVDDTYNKEVASINYNSRILKESKPYHQLNLRYGQIPLSNSQAYINSVENSPLSQSKNFNQVSLGSVSNRHVKYVTSGIGNMLLAKMQVKLRALGPEGMINLYHQFRQKDKSSQNILEYYDFRTVILTYRIDFEFDDCIPFVHSRANHLNLHKISYKKFMFDLGSYNESRQNFISYVFSELDKDQDQFLNVSSEYSEVIKQKLNGSYLSDQDKSTIFAFKRLSDSYILGSSYSVMSLCEFHFLGSFFSISFSSDEDFKFYFTLILLQ